LYIHTHVQPKPCLPSPDSHTYNVGLAGSSFCGFFLLLNLTRGVSKLKYDGIGLINYQNTRYQGHIASIVLKRLNIKVEKVYNEPWSYVTFKNVNVASGGSYHGKHYYIDYEQDVELSLARYTSIMFKIRKTEFSLDLLKPNQEFKGNQKSIYDF